MKSLLFKGEMVRAILAGSKTQHRVIGSYQGAPIGHPDFYTGLGISWIGHAIRGDVIQATYDAYPGRGPARHAIEECRFGVPGDRLYVKETFQQCPSCFGVVYRADTDSQTSCPHCGDKLGKWKPSIFMPEKLSRIILAIVGIRVERLQYITEEDAKAEGVKPPQDHYGRQFPNYYRDGYSILWQSISGPGSWDKNPWVWVIEFRKV